MNSDWIQNSVSKLSDSGLLNGVALQGCSETEIRQIENTCPKPLPAAYKKFLSVLGVTAGSFLRGSDFLLSTLPTLRSGAQRLLEESGAAYALAADDFVFASHQGYTFLFFKLGEGDDPKVYRYVEGDEKPELVSNTFSDWFSLCVDEEIGAFRSVSKK